MAVHFHPLKVRDIKRETEDCVSIGFDISPEQWAAFNFREGQNITLKKTINGQDVRRSYSICTAPHEKTLRVAVKKVEGGVFSRFANLELKDGDEIEVLPPTGTFNAKMKEGLSGNYLAIAAGSGITPVVSIIKHTLLTQPGSTFTLLYNNRNRQSIIFFEELEAIKNKFMGRFNLVYIFSREKTEAAINSGRINADKLRELNKIVPYTRFDSIYLCGPEEMIFTASDFFKQLGIPGSKVHFELFTTPGQTAFNKARPADVAYNPGDFSQVSVKLDGRTVEFALAYEGNSILDAALAAGADLPYACKGGVCASCKAKLTEGKIEMDVNYALEEEEVAQGFILTCQAHPRTPVISVDFDVK